MQTLRLTALAAATILLPGIAGAEWKATEIVETYPVRGRTGLELYESIGQNGPMVRKGSKRAIAHTNFKLTWSRRYENEAGACRLVHAVPKLTITYTLPKPSKPLPESVARDWEAFIAGIRAHEKVHGDFIRDMVKEIEKATIGMSVPDDPKCRKIRTELNERLTRIHAAYRERNRAFEQKEMAPDGAIQRLILSLVNAGSH